MVPYKDIETAEKIRTPLSADMINAMDAWYNAYLNRGSWLNTEDSTREIVKSMNLPSFIASEIARQIVIELKWDITGPDGEENDRSAFLREEFEKVFNGLRLKLEQGCAAGGLALRPYPQNMHFSFAWTYDWSLFPVAFDSDGRLMDVIFQDAYTQTEDGKVIYYTRLERHRRDGDNVVITQHAYRSANSNSIGDPVELSTVPIWADLVPESTVQDVEGQLFGWFKVANANNIDPESPMGASVYSKAMDEIAEADRQYSRVLWEYEASEMAIDVDPTALRPKANASGVQMPKLNQRLFRAVDIDKGDRDLYEVFAPNIRDVNLINGLNQHLMHIENQCGLSRGTIADVDATDARTATEMRILKQRSYMTIADNQTALEQCFRDVIRAMDKFATMYHMAPEGEYAVSFDWDDSILVDKAQEKSDDLALVSAGLMSKSEFRQKYFGETEEQANAALRDISLEQYSGLQALLPNLDVNALNNNPPAEEV